MRNLIYIYCLLGTLFPFSSYAEEIPVAIDADRIVSEDNGATVTATGSVVITRQELTLKADSITLDRDNEQATAEGNVVIDRNGDILRGDRVSLDLGAHTGTISNASLEVAKSGLKVTGAEIRKVDDLNYQVTRGALTTCEGSPPAWQFSASDVNINEKYASGRNVVFSVSDVPVFYTPYLLIPVARERQTGLLLPTTGISSKSGFFLDIPYYLNISPSQEATVTLDIESKRGVGLRTDYRYLRPRGGSGNLNGFMIYDLSQDRFRGTVQERHQEHISSTLSFKSDIELTTDQDFFRDFGASTGDYNRQILESNVFLTKNGEFWSFTPQIKYTENLDTPNNAATLQQLPTLTFAGIKRPVLDPLFISVDSSFTNFYRMDGLQGQRMRVFPLATIYWSPLSWLNTATWGGYNQSAYNAYGAPSDGGNFFGYVDAGTSVSTTLSKVFSLDAGPLERLRHVMIPELNYHFMDSFDSTPTAIFDYTDTLTRQSVIMWSLANYLNGRYRTADGASEYRELLYFRFSQGFDFRESSRDLLNPSDQLRPFTDVRLEARLSPYKNVSVDSDARFNVYDVRFTSADLGAQFNSEDENRFRLAYHYAKTPTTVTAVTQANPAGDTVIAPWDYLEGQVGLHLAKPLFVRYLSRYAIQGGRFLENTVALEYRHQCWGITFSFQNREDATRFMVNFSLNGIGSVGSAAKQQ